MLKKKGIKLIWQKFVLAPCVLYLLFKKDENVTYKYFVHVVHLKSGLFTRCHSMHVMLCFPNSFRVQKQNSAR